MGLLAQFVVLGAAALVANAGTPSYDKSRYEIPLMVDCGKVQPPLYGRVIENGTMEGDTIMFYCYEGFELVGSTDAECLHTGNWSAKVPQCQRKDCGQLWPPQNGRMIENGTLYCDTIEFECDTGYTLIGSTSAECMSTGKWSTDVPQCQEIPCPGPNCLVDCGQVQPPKNGFVMENGTMIGDIIKFGCNEGYDLDGSTDAECLFPGNWSANVPQCQRKDCGPVSPPQHGSMIENGIMYGDTIRFECDEGYYLHGSTGAECLSTGKWSAEVPQCHPPQIQLECPEDRRMPGDCSNWDDKITGTTPAPPTRCYNNGDCPSGLLCCYDACLGQTCKNPIPEPSKSASIPDIDVRSPASIRPSSVRSTDG